MATQRRTTKRAGTTGARASNETRSTRHRRAGTGRRPQPAEQGAAAGVRTALVLQGGAALGAYEAGVLQAMLEAKRRLDVVTGCSIGALMAAIVVGSRGDPVEALQDMWRRFTMPVNPFMLNLFARSLPVPGGGNVYRPNPLYFTMPALATHMYETAPLEAALKEWVDFRRLNRSSTEVIITAVEVKTGKLAEFSNHRDGLKPAHIVASASLPPVFPVTAIDSGEYWDGGLISATPLRPAINAMEKHNQIKRAPIWELVIVDLFTPSPRPPADLTDVLQRAFELVFFGKFQHDLKLFEWMNSELDLMIEVDRALPKTSAVRRHPAYLKLKRHRRVDKLTILRASDPQALGGPADFSHEAIEHRLRLGYADGTRMLHGSRSARRAH